jgi:NAD-dependent dihydropyrimidine dehydrogenase PreA subunit
VAYTISDTCLACGACIPECPADAIVEGTPYTIDEGKCTDCGVCVDSCPVEAISQA